MSGRVSDRTRYACLIGAGQIAEAMNDGRVGFEDAHVERGAPPLAPIVEQTVRAASA
jgi:hypothetical protein